MYRGVHSPPHLDIEAVTIEREKNKNYRKKDHLYSSSRSDRTVSLTTILFLLIVVITVLISIVNVKVGITSIVNSLTTSNELSTSNVIDKNSNSTKINSNVDKNIISNGIIINSNNNIIKKNEEKPIPKYPGCLNYLPPNPNEKHIVQPPAGNVHLVCCSTTKGVFNFRVHPSWCPLGAQRFLDMVNDNFFSNPPEGVGLFRAIKDFLIQFGLSGNTTIQTKWDNKGWLIDDPPWLPLGPTGRKINGTLRYQKGYFSYAGGGKNSRGTQLILAFRDNEYLGGGSPWEVPFGQLFGDNSFKTLGKIYTGYGEKVSQGKIRNRGSSYIKAEFPLLDYMTECHIEATNVPWTYIHKTS